MNTPTLAQRLAIESNHPLILCLAGPGSGKTSTLIARLCRLIEGGADPGKIVCITFTNAAAKEMAERLARNWSDDGIPPPQLGYLGTLHGYALRMLSRYGRSMGYGERITVLDQEQADEMMEATARDLTGKMCSLKKLQEARENLRTGVKPRTVPELAVAAYWRRLRKDSACDFDTILADFLQLCRIPRGEAGSLPSIDHLFVDEFQDSAQIDADIYAAMPALNRFYVGDPDQAIYGFRGGSLNPILGLGNGSLAEVHRLEGNFRCARMICRAANLLISRNQFRLPKATEALRPEPFGKVLVADWESDEEERFQVIRDIADSIEEHNEMASEIAILCRTNALAEEFSRAAEGMGISVRKKKTADLPMDWSRARAALDILNAPRSDLALLRFIRESSGADEASEWRRRAAKEQKAVWQIYQSQPLEPPASWKAAATALARFGLSFSSVERIAEKAGQMPSWDLGALCLELLRDIDASPEWGEGITITTYHASKGREWRRVFLPALEDQIMPGRRKDTNMEEARRLLFVAVTRAKESLLLSYAKSRRQTWGARAYAPATPSRFIAEMGLLATAP